MTDHPAWTQDGGRDLVRAMPVGGHALVRTDGRTVTWCCPQAAASAPEPGVFALPGPATRDMPELGPALGSLGPVARFANPSLWDAIATAIIRQVTAAGTGDWARWDATGRINVLNRLDDADLAGLAAAGLREVALGIESGSQRMLDSIDKRITPRMARDVTRRLTQAGINVKGYFIFGFPGETIEEVDATVALIRDLWDITDPLPGGFTASAFEYRPYPGTPDWDRLIATGRHTPAELLNYTAVDLTIDGTDEAMLERDEFNFSVNLPLADAPISHIRASLVAIAREQYARFPGTAA